MHPDQAAAAQAKLDALFAAAGQRPNIVWLVVDDMGYGDPGAFGGGAAIGAATPNMDRLAREGLKLTSTYSQATCTPTRSAILTGRLPVRTGLTRPILAGDKLTKNPWADEISLPTLLGEAGYATVLSGKWHVGEAEGMRPHDIGFDEFYGYYEAEKEISQRPSTSAAIPTSCSTPSGWRCWRRPGASNALIHGFKGGETTDVEQIDSIERWPRPTGCSRISRSRRSPSSPTGDKPFFLEHAFMKVHADNFASKAFEGKSGQQVPLQGRRRRGRRLHRRDRRRARRGGRARQHLRLRHLRQRPAAR